MFCLCIKGYVGTGNGMISGEGKVVTKGLGRSMGGLRWGNDAVDAMGGVR